MVSFFLYISFIIIPRGGEGGGEDEKARKARGNFRNFSLTISTQSSCSTFESYARDVIIKVSLTSVTDIHGKSDVRQKMFNVN